MNDAARLHRLVVCPRCKGPLEDGGHTLRCVACELAWEQPADHLDLLWPPPEGDAQPWSQRQARMEEWYRNLLADPERAEASFRKDLDLVSRRLRGFAGDVIDIGGGNGIVRDALPRDVRYVSVDPSALWTSLDFSPLAETFPCLGSLPAFVRAWGEHLPFPPASFDGALALWSLNHAGRPAEIVAEAARVLRPGGRMLVVLEDMRPTWSDIARSGRRPWQRATLQLVATKALSHARLRPWPGGDDHSPVPERALRRWLGRRFRIEDRAWLRSYLCFELVRR